MYIGHFGAAAVIAAALPEPAALPVAVGVAWPDLVWPVLVWAGIEKVEVDPNNPLQGAVRFAKYPYSHSLVLSNALALVPAAIVGIIYGSPLIAVAFWLAAVSHWVLDAVVHLGDLPVAGWGRDRRVGLRLWSRPRLAFVAEYALFAAAIFAAAPQRMWIGLLAGGALLHLFNVNSFFGLTKANPVGTANRFAGLSLVGYGVAIAWFTMAWQ